MKHEEPHGAPGEAGLETDPRFPSGAWTGFFLQKLVNQRGWMELDLRFRAGVIRGSGSDFVGGFTLQGAYDLGDGRCYLHKSYIGQHSVFYSGYNEGKGIWGTWQIPPFDNGGFHIWPAGRGEGEALAEEAEAPLEEEIAAGRGVALAAGR
jgi:hypothetical protein